MDAPTKKILRHTCDLLIVLVRCPQNRKLHSTKKTSMCQALNTGGLETFRSTLNAPSHVGSSASQLRPHHQPPIVAKTSETETPENRFPDALGRDTIDLQTALPVELGRFNLLRGLQGRRYSKISKAKQAGLHDNNSCDFLCSDVKGQLSLTCPAFLEGV